MKITRRDAGFSLVELLVAVAIISIAGLGIAGSFSYISKATLQARDRSLATNLVQEQVEALKGKGYFEILPTSTPAYDDNFSPPVPYDSVYYPPESLPVGAKAIIRYTYVERMEDVAGSLSPAPYNGLDTGIKRITVTSVWLEGSHWKKQSVSNLVSNSDRAASGSFAGTVLSSDGDAIKNARVFVSNDASFYGYSDATGQYGFTAAPGAYSLRATAPGYSPSPMISRVVTVGNTETQDFVLTPFSSGSVSGSVWTNGHLLVTQVVSSTLTVVGDLSVRDVEYVELFNPTTFPIDIGEMADGFTLLNYKGQIVGEDELNIFLTYVSTYVGPGRYYLIANSTSFVVLGDWVAADAYYTALYDDVIKKNKSGAIQVTDQDGNIFDGVGWRTSVLENDGMPSGAPWREGPSIYQNGGLMRGDQLVRMSGISGVGSSYGRAYDSDENATNFGYKGHLLSTGEIEHPPFNSETALPVISGTPAYGAVVTADDGFSASTRAYRTDVTGYSYATFTLVGIATGTWSVYLSSGSAFLRIDSVSVNASGSDTAVPNAATTPPWIIADIPAGFLTDSTDQGTVAGVVRDPDLNPLAAIEVEVHPIGSVFTNASGEYSIQVPAGTHAMTANPNSADRSYTTSGVPAVVVAVGQVTSGVDFILSSAGGMTGYVCNSDAVNAYPGISVAAYDLGGNLVGQAVTGSDGTFLIAGISTGSYRIIPTLAGGQASDPASVALTTISGGDVFVSTFVISGAYAVIMGSATLNGLPLRSGALVIATTGAITTPLPPSLSNPGLQSQVPFYMTSTRSDGTYSLRVRTSTAAADFNVYAWHTTFDGETPVVVKKSLTVSVTGGQTASLGLEWP